MAWFRLLQDFDYSPTPASTIAYLAGRTYNAPSAAVEAAVVAGKAVRLRAPRKGEVATDDS